MWTTVKNKKIVTSHTIYSLLEIEPFTEFFTVEKFRSYIHPQDVFKFIQTEDKLLHSGQQVSVEYRVIGKNGTQKFISHYMQLHIDQNNELKIVSILDDITEQKSAEVILETMNEVFFELDEHFILKRVNKKAEHFWQKDRDQLIGKSIFQVFPAAAESTVSRLIHNVLKEKISIAQDVRWPSNERWVHASVGSYRKGVIVVLYDIQNEKKQAEENLRKSEAKWRTLVENTPDLISRWDKNMKLLYANPVFENLLNISLPAAQNKNAITVLKTGWEPAAGNI